MTRLWAALAARALDERGDIPGWVMITVMTAAVAMVLWGLASSTFQHLFTNAFASVGPTGG